MKKTVWARLAGVQDFHEDVDGHIVVYWIATDTAGRRFRAATRDEALRMLEQYNQVRKEKQ
jgi:hypothetical protein